MPRQSATVQPQQCPLCGRANACQMAAGGSGSTSAKECWCTKATFSNELLARVPPASKNRACICAACAGAAAAAGDTGIKRGR